jgi:hypothetical protein
VRGDSEAGAEGRTEGRRGCRQAAWQAEREREDTLTGRIFVHAVCESERRGEL